MNTHVITFSDLSRIYTVGSSSIAALSNINLQIKRNEMLAIVGQSGSGKSTMLNILGCLDTPSSGEYILNNIKVENLTDVQKAIVRNEEIGFIFQNFNLLPRYSAIENVMLPLQYAGVEKRLQREMAEEALLNVDLAERMLHKPNELSGGQRQRVAIARALVNKPSILLADEPTGNLDSKSAESIMALLHKIHSQGNTVLIVTHDNEIAHSTQRIITLKDGQITDDQQN